MPCPYLIEYVKPPFKYACKAVMWGREPVSRRKAVIIPRPLPPTEVKKCMDDKLWPKCPDYIRAKAYEKK